MPSPESLEPDSETASFFSYIGVLLEPLTVLHLKPWDLRHQLPQILLYRCEDLYLLLCLYLNPLSQIQKLLQPFLYRGVELFLPSCLHLDPWSLIHPTRQIAILFQLISFLILLLPRGPGSTGAASGTSGSKYGLRSPCSPSPLSLQATLCWRSRRGA